MTSREVVLIINSGSSSLKFSLYDRDAPGNTPCYRGLCDYSRTPLVLRVEDLSTTPSTARDLAVGAPSPPERLAAVIDALQRWLAQSGQHLAAVGHRVVHGGPRYTQPVVVDDEVLANLETLVPWAPLHQADCLRAIQAWRKAQPLLLQVACFDTAFHATLPHEAASYALPRDLTARGLRRYGFHGLSFQSIVAQLRHHAPQVAAGRVVVAHLGSGSSLCGMVAETSQATTMGLTPLEGLPMATRCGSVDPGLVLHLLNEHHGDVAAVQSLLYRQSGLLGVSQLSGDLRTLLASDSDEAAAAVELLVYRIVREIGSIAAALGGIDALVFTGGIGENSPEIRQRVCRRLAWWGLDLDDTANHQAATTLHTQDSRIAIFRLPADEASVIAAAVQTELDRRASHHTLE